MKFELLSQVYIALAFATLGCSGAQVTQQSSAPPIVSTRPSSVAIYPFAVSSADVSLNSGVFQTAHRNVTDENETEQQTQIAHQTAQNICISVAAELTNKGMAATCLQRGVRPSGSNALILDGQFTDISEGNGFLEWLLGSVRASRSSTRWSKWFI